MQRELPMTIKQKKEKKNHSCKNKYEARKLFTLKQLEPTPIFLSKSNRICPI